MIAPFAIDVALPTDVTTPVKLAFVVTVDALPAKLAVIVPAVKLPLASRATIVDGVFAFVAFDVTVNVAGVELSAENDADPRQTSS